MNNRAMAILLPLTLLVASHTAGAADSDPRAVVEQRYRQINDVIATLPDEAAMRTKIKQLTTEFVDYEEFAQATLKGSWDKLTEAQRKEFTVEYKSLIQSTYARYFKPKKDIGIAYRGDTEYVESKAQVRSTIRVGDASYDVDYRFTRRADGSWWVYDIVIDDVSLVANYRGQFRKILGKDGYPALITKVKDAVARKESGPADASVAP